MKQTCSPILPLALDPKSSVTLLGAPSCPLLEVQWGVQGPSLRTVWDHLPPVNPASPAQGTSSLSPVTEDQGASGKASYCAVYSLLLLFSL